MQPYHNVFVVLVALRNMGSIQPWKFVLQSFYKTCSKKNLKKSKTNKQKSYQPKRKNQTKQTEKPNKKRREDKQLI